MISAHLSRQICSELFWLFAWRLSTVIFKYRRRFSDEMRSLAGWLWDIWLFCSTSMSGIIDLLKDELSPKLQFFCQTTSGTLYFSVFFSFHYFFYPMKIAQSLLMKKSHLTWCFNTGMVFLTCKSLRSFPTCGWIAFVLAQTLSCHMVLFLSNDFFCHPFVQASDMHNLWNCWPVRVYSVVNDRALEVPQSGRPASLRFFCKLQTFEGWPFLGGVWVAWWFHQHSKWFYCFSEMYTFVSLQLKLRNALKS